MGAHINIPTALHSRVINAPNEMKYIRASLICRKIMVLFAWRHYFLRRRKCNVWLILN